MVGTKPEIEARRRLLNAGLAEHLRRVRAQNVNALADGRDSAVAATFDRVIGELVATLNVEILTAEGQRDAAAASHAAVLAQLQEVRRLIVATPRADYGVPG